MKDFKTHSKNKNKKIYKAFIGFHGKGGLKLDEDYQKIFNALGNTKKRHTIFRKKNEHLKNTFDNTPLTKIEKHSLKSYTGGKYKEINMRKLNPTAFMSDDQRHVADWHLSNISSALHKIKAPRNFHVFSGMRSPEGLQEHNEHIHIKNPGFTSTSTDPSVAKDFSKEHKRIDGKDSEHVYRYETKEKYDHNNEEHVKSTPSQWIKYKHMAKIHIPKGSHGAFIHSVSNYPGEKEYLLHHGAQVAFHHKPTVDHHKRLVIWHGKLIHDGIEPTRHAKAFE